jgi:hypothetical protein
MEEIRCCGSATDASSCRVHELGIERLPAEVFPEQVGVRRIGEAVDQMPAVLMDDRMMPWSQRQVFAKALDERAVSTGASVSGYDDLVREFAIEPALAEFAFTPGHAPTRASPVAEIVRHLAKGL